MMGKKPKGQRPRLGLSQLSLTLRSTVPVRRSPVQVIPRYWPEGCKTPMPWEPGTEEGCRKRSCHIPGVLKDKQLSLKPGKQLT